MRVTSSRKPLITLIGASGIRGPGDISWMTEARARQRVPCECPERRALVPGGSCWGNPLPTRRPIAWCPAYLAGATRDQVHGCAVQVSSAISAGSGKSSNHLLSSWPDLIRPSTCFPLPGSMPAKTWITGPSPVMTTEGGDSLGALQPNLLNRTGVDQQTTLHIRFRTRRKFPLTALRFRGSHAPNAQQAAFCPI